MKNKPPLRLVKVPADKFGHGYDHFRLREDFAESYRCAYDQIHALGGIVTSSGSHRRLSEKVTKGRSPLSLHYLGRAFDLFVGSGMSSDRDPYAIRRCNNAEPPQFEVLCRREHPLRSSPLFAAGSLIDGEIEALIWRRGVGFETVKRPGKWLSLTSIFAKHGWRPISARPGWTTDYSCLEWWHFQNDNGLIDGQTTFGEDLLKIYPPSLVTGSGLPRSAVWRDGRFRGSG